MSTREKILIVDDDRFVRMALGEALRKWDYETLEAENVAQAKKAFEDAEPAIVLLDIDLPDGSGLDVLSDIKEKKPETIAVMQDVSARMGKETVLVKESPGFVTSRINAMIGNEAFYMLQDGVASARDIDKALKLGLNHPMGPFELVDLVGLDTRLSILQYLHRTLGEKFRPCPLLEKHVADGRLGRKVGRGVYDY